MHLIDDRYELLDVIASGGMATVWRSRDTRLDRLVALKRPHPGPPEDESMQRLGREARAAAALNHPNLITVYDFGTDDTGPYLVMELVDGPTLEELAGDIPSAGIRDLGASLAGGLAAIHDAGIVHRDVKPANVIMSERGPLLTDFGIARDASSTTEITAPGSVVATPSYAAPEVLKGEPSTPASDVYSLGVMLDELMGKTQAEPDPGLKAAVGSATAATPSDRPTADGLVAALGLSSPTVTTASAGGTTMILEATSPADSTGEIEPDRRRAPGWPMVAGVLAVLALGLMAIGLALSGEDPPADAATSPTDGLAGTTSSSAELRASTSFPSTTTTSPSTSTTATLETRVSQARDRLEAVLLQPPRSDINRRDAEDIVKKVDEGIEAAKEGDLEKAEKKLVETRERLEDLDGEKGADALAALGELADLLGVDLERGDRGDDDDD